MLKILFLIFLSNLPYFLVCLDPLISNSLALSNPSNFKPLQFQDQFNSIRNKVDYVHRTLDLNDTDKFSFIIDRCNEITSGLNLLQKAMVNNDLHINQKNNECIGLTTFNRTLINRYLVYTQLKLNIVQQYYPTCQDCPFIFSDIQDMINTTRTYFKYINRTLDGDFCNKLNLSQKSIGLVNINHSYYKNNLNAENWYYGSISKSDYKITAFKRSATYNLTDCPLQTPFVKDNDAICFNCPKGSIFDLGKQECLMCEINKFFNVTTGGCQICIGDKRVVNHSIICLPCPMHEYYNQTVGQCLSCKITQFFNPIDFTCKPINCSGNKPRFNRKTLHCQPCPLSQTISSSNPSECIKTNYIGLCPSNLPIYNMTKKECEACPHGSSFDKNRQICLSNTAKVSI